MKIDFADSTKEPSLSNLNLIMHEVAEEALHHQKLAAECIEKAIQFHLISLKKKYKLKR
jgi:hypothetical protein